MEDRCISCGAVVPEGTMICPTCEYEAKRIQEESAEHMSETESKAHKRLVELIKAAGRHLISNADNIAGTDDLISNLSINVDEHPIQPAKAAIRRVFRHISVTREHVSREFMHVYENKELF